MEDPNGQNEQVTGFSSKILAILINAAGQSVVPGKPFDLDSFTEGFEDIPSNVKK